MTTCGERKSVDGGTPLVCNLDPGHALPHAVMNAGAPFAVWPVKPDDEIGPRGRKNRGKRRPYQTLSMWKAGR